MLLKFKCMCREDKQQLQEERGDWTGSKGLRSLGVSVYFK